MISEAIIATVVISSVLSTTTVSITTMIISFVHGRTDLLKDRNKRDILGIIPFVDIKAGSPCIKCGALSKHCYIDNGLHYIDEGPILPQFCIDKRCKCKKISQLHVTCNSCKAVWFMDTV